MDLRSPALNHLLDIWLDEDLGRGDLTRNVLQEKTTSAYWIAKTAGIFCGCSLVKQLFKKLDPTIKIKFLIEDGDQFESGQKLLELTGKASALVAGERTSLNIAMHLSGVSTATAILVEQLKGTGIQLADTRKTTPGLRILEKYAFRCGGGVNHRLGLDDAAMLKENHIAWSKGIESAVKTLKKNLPWTTKIIVEAETPEQAEEAVRAGADGILLDEMSPALIKDLVPKLRTLALNHGNPGNIVLEISGINPMQLKQYRETGVDLISSSSPITKSDWIDFSMRFNEDI